MIITVLPHGPALNFEEDTVEILVLELGGKPQTIILGEKTPYDQLGIETHNPHVSLGLRGI